MLPIKLSFNNEVRRISSSSAVQDNQISYSKLSTMAYTLFPTLVNKPLTFLWRDDESDIVCCSSDEEIAEALRVMQSESNATFKFAVEISKSSRAGDLRASSAVIHRHVKCDGCGMKPIVGSRFKCTVRENFDLCEGCERSAQQPHPMLKIYDPKQSPELIFVAMQENSRPATESLKCPSDHVMERLNTLPARYNGCAVCDCCNARIIPEQSFHHCSICNYDVCNSCSGHSAPPARGGHCVFGRNGFGKKWRKCGRASERCERGRFFEGARRPLNCPFERLQQLPLPCAPLVEAFVEAVCQGDVAGELSCCNTELSPSSSACPAAACPSACPASDISESIEQQILDAVAKESLLDAETAPVVSQSTNLSASSSQIFSALPSMKFVSDVTFPDSSVVQACSVLNKTWKIKNDGNVAWPEGSCLSACGGDNLCGEITDFEVPQNVQPGQEVELSVSITAPRSWGRYVSYFRLKDASGKYFGQRLWADISVAEEEEPDWDVVGQSDPVVSINSEIKPSVAETEPTPAPPSVSENASVPVPTLTSTSTDVVVEDVESDDEAGDNFFAEEEIKWARELHVLREMGFLDRAVLIPLLLQHLPEPSAFSEPQRAEHLQHIIIALLGSSMTA